jgi:hypothetical protein
MDARAYREGEEVLRKSSGGDVNGVLVHTLRRRRLPSAAEQARREAWGAKWGPIMREAAREKGLGGKR